MPVEVDTSLNEDLTRIFASEPAAIQNPYPVWDRLREAAPIYELGANTLVSRHEDIAYVLRSAHLFAAARGARKSSRALAQRAALAPEHQKMWDFNAGIEGLAVLAAHGDDHKKLRGLYHKLFTPRRIAQLEDATRRYVDQLLDEQKANDVADLAYVSFRLPSWIICDLLGVPHEDSERLLKWTYAILLNAFGGQGTEVLEGAYNARREFQQYVFEMVADHRSGKNPSELFGVLLDAREHAAISDEQLSALFMEMMAGGFETSRILMSAGIFEMLRARDQWAELVTDPDLAGGATEEALRYCSPAHYTARVALQDIEVGGEAISEGTALVLCLAGANRDPDVYADPHRFDIQRFTRKGPEVKQHLAFGFGPHFCLGHNLARLEGRVLFETMARRFPDAELVTQELDWMPPLLNRRPREVNVRLGAER